MENGRECNFQKYSQSQLSVRSVVARVNVGLSIGSRKNTKSQYSNSEEHIFRFSVRAVTFTLSWLHTKSKSLSSSCDLPLTASLLVSHDSILENSLCLETSGKWGCIHCDQKTYIRKTFAEGLIWFRSPWKRMLFGCLVFGKCDLCFCVFSVKWVYSCINPNLSTPQHPIQNNKRKIQFCTYKVWILYIYIYSTYIRRARHAIYRNGALDMTMIICAVHCRIRAPMSAVSST